VSIGVIRGEKENNGMSALDIHAFFHSIIHAFFFQIP